MDHSHQREGILSNRDVINIILYIRHRGGKVSATSLLDVSGNYHRALKVVRQLIDEGIIKEEIIKKPLLRRNLSLTEKGKELAEALEQAVEILEKEEEDKEDSGPLILSLSGLVLPLLACLS